MWTDRSPLFSRDGHWNLLALCAGGLLLNFLGIQLTHSLGLPLFLNCIGSLVAAALGGLMPGVLVGFLTYAIQGLEGGTFSMTALVGAATALLASRGCFRKISRLPGLILLFALCSGGIGSALDWLRNGFTFSQGVSAPLARQLFALGLFSPFFSQLIADLLIELLDKTISVLAAVLILRLLPSKCKNRFSFYASCAVARERGPRHKFSLRFKVLLLVGLTTLVTAITVTAISFIHFKNAFVEEQTALAQGIVQVLVDTVDAEMVDEYLEKGEAAPGYPETKALLQSLMDNTENIEFCYVYRILEDGCHVVFDPDTPEIPGADPGEVLAFDEAFLDLLPDLLAGKEIPPRISDDTYGWLLTVYSPIRDSQGRCRCYAGVDINMDYINTTGFQFLSRVISLFFGFFLLIITIAIWLAEHQVILPINSMAITTSRFAFDSEAARDAALKSIEALHIHTGDEIENLFNAVVRTTEDMVAYIAQMQRQNEVIGKLQNGLIMVLADLVESRDKCTGDHVRKTAAYTRIIMDRLKKDGIYADRLTDAYMQDVENSAPLHDVGKIQVPDAILNKPGKLTPEEFERMKTHTTAGSEIISRAIETVSEENSGYLKEARNLAHYHHEKWNGSGYPCGLKGEEIPLSARIMAVADVFDALVSRRSYKEGMPFEKAMDIIREGSGSHFDPQVAGAFLRAEDEVRRVMNTYMGG